MCHPSRIQSLFPNIYNLIKPNLIISNSFMSFTSMLFMFSSFLFVNLVNHQHRKNNIVYNPFFIEQYKLKSSKFFWPSKHITSYIPSPWSLLQFMKQSFKPTHFAFKFWPTKSFRYLNVHFYKKQVILIYQVKTNVPPFLCGYCNNDWPT
jgi:hypothetical protein